jgi:ribosomal protein S18 acetylase RimI-like enzyme
MWRPLEAVPPEPRFPADVVVRTYEARDAPAVKELLDTAYSGWNDAYVARDRDEWERWMTEHDEFDPRLWFLVERDGEVVACALHWRETERQGWVKDLVVREDERGRGLAKALLRLGFRAYAERGVERVGLKVDSRNPTGALQLYERLGFVVDPTFSPEDE